MRLIDYPALLGKWPPPAHDPAGKLVQMEDCLDTLVIAFSQPSSGSGLIRIRILTIFQGVLAMREIPDQEEIFAQVFCGFLNKNRDKTIREIGHIEATFLV
jgi:hypothetical protein